MSGLMLTGLNDCVSDLAYVKSQKEIVDYVTKNLGNPSKTSITPAQLQKMQNEYNALQAKYDSSGCGKDVDQDKCLSYQTRIANLRSSITYSINTRNNAHADELKGRLEEEIKKYKNLNCDEKINQYRGGVVMSIAEIYQQMDKERIQKDIEYQFKQRLFFGGLVVFGALLMITMFGKKN
jgi:hypothetical protein